MLGEEKPYKPPQQYKKPRFAIVCTQQRPCGPTAIYYLLGCLNSLGTTTSFFSSLSKAKVYTLARPCQLINYYMLIASYILTTPYILSLILTIAIYAIPPPPQSHQRRKGDSSVLTTALIPKGKRDIYMYSGYFLCLGPGRQALSKGYYSIKRRQGKP